MTLVEALRTGKPFRRPTWVDRRDQFQWVQYHSGFDMFEWSNPDGLVSGNSFGTIEHIVFQNPLGANDYEVMP